MRISTTTGAWRDRRDGQYVPINECIPRPMGPSTMC